MRMNYFVGSLLGAALFTTTAFAQTPTAPAPSAHPTPAVAPTGDMGHWRASKLIGVNIYNEQNDKLGDINEIILDSAGKITGYVIGVGGFLGMGEHDILVEPSKIKFVNEARTVAASAKATTATTSPTTGTNTAPATTRNVNRAPRAANEKWYPDHGVLNATKDQLKAMQEFKYSTYN